MSRLAAAALAAVLVLLAVAPGVRAQAAAAEPPRSGPDALWDAFPLEQRPRAADGAGEAGVTPSSGAGGDRVAFRQGDPAEAPTLTVLTAVCLGAGLLLSAAGLLLGRSQSRRGRHGRARFPRPWP